MDPEVNCSESKKRVKACGQALPTHNEAAILLLEPGKRALHLKAWDNFLDPSFKESLRFVPSKWLQSQG